jgi:hypothetical protein
MVTSHSAVEYFMPEIHTNKGTPAAAKPIGGVFPWGANRSILFSMVMVGWVVS